MTIAALVMKEALSIIYVLMATPTDDVTVVPPLDDVTAKPRYRSFTGGVDA